MNEQHQLKNDHDFYGQFHKNHFQCYDYVNTWVICIFMQDENDMEILYVVIILLTIKDDHNQVHINLSLQVYFEFYLIVFIVFKNISQQILLYLNQMVI